MYELKNFFILISQIILILSTKLGMSLINNLSDLSKLCTEKRLYLLLGSNLIQCFMIHM